MKLLAEAILFCAAFYVVVVFVWFLGGSDILAGASGMLAAGHAVKLAFPDA